MDYSRKFMTPLGFCVILQGLEHLFPVVVLKTSIPIRVGAA